MLDANDDINNKDFGTFLEKSDLFDILGNQHSTHSPATYIRGTKTIDYILGTRNVILATHRCGMAAFNTQISSDHRALWADIDIPQLLKGSIPRIQLHLRQPIKSSQTKKMRKIREGAIKLFRTKQISQRLKNLLRDISSLTRDQAF